MFAQRTGIYAGASDAVRQNMLAIGGQRLAAVPP